MDSSTPSKVMAMMKMGEECIQISYVRHNRNIDYHNNILVWPKLLYI